MGAVIPHLSSWLLVIAAGVNSCIGNLLLKQSQRTGSTEGLAGLLFSPWFIAGLAFYGVNVILFAKALENLPVSRAYPVLAGVGFALVAGSGALLFGERFQGLHITGLVLILLGIMLIAR